MEIQKVFSNIEDPEETLYSVLMSEEELSLFSEDEEKKNKLKDAGLVAGSVGLATGGNLLGDKVTEMSGKYLINSKLTAKDKDAIKKKLLEKAKKQGIKVIDDPNFENSAYTGGKLGKKLKDGFASVAKKLRKTGNKDSARNFIEEVNESSRSAFGSKKVIKSLGKDRILLGKGNLSEADVFSHELGHAQYMKPGRSKSIVGKAAHGLTPVSSISNLRVGQAASFAHGFQAGMKKEKNKQEGKKTNKWDKVRSVAVPAALAAPVLVAEGKASLNGLRNMKKSGASKELMKQSKKRLASAWGTYAGQASKSVFAGGAGELAGRGIARLKKDKKE